MTELKKIFLSASLPHPGAAKRFYAVSDPFATRSAIRALAGVVAPHATLVYGGHPAVTPLVRSVLSRMDEQLNRRVTVYQSKYFWGSFPVDDFYFRSLRIEAEADDRKSSLAALRKTMITENEFAAGVFIGGMDGVLEEYRLFREAHPQAQVVPVASTGAAARIIYKKHGGTSSKLLLQTYAYTGLFRDLLNEHLQ